VREREREESSMEECDGKREREREGGRGKGEGNGQENDQKRAATRRHSGISCFRIRRGGERGLFTETCREYKGDAPFIDSIRSFFPPFLHLLCSEE